ncbi:hypothetical protein MRBBS_3666 [Marinobacter sp. BSs20148]|nr:hypothetical protein MRBBS_3666 [Marinobacter sp. BSs20148]
MIGCFMWLLNGTAAATMGVLPIFSVAALVCRAVNYEAYLRFFKRF